MQATFSLRAGEFNPAFLKKLETIVAGNAVDITLNIKSVPKKTQDIPNAETLAAMKEARQIISSKKKGTTDVKALFAKLDEMEM